MAKNGKKNGRRIRSPHPGVVLQRKTHRSGRTTWRARYIDPDTGKKKYVAMEPLGKTNAESREDWAIKLSNKLRDRKADIAAGMPKKVETGISTAIKEYFKNAEKELKPRTIKSYRASTDLFLEWAAQMGLKQTKQITPPLLSAFRAEIIARPKQRPVRGGRRGKHLPKKERRSPATINRDLLQVRVVLNELRRMGQLPMLDSDAIKDNLRNVKGKKPVPTFLRTPDLKKILKAARRHDAEKFAETRAEHRGEGDKGNTNCYEPITPFILVTLLTGARFGEVSTLRWRDVNLEDDEILIAAEQTKTGHGRRIDLSVTPGLKALLSALRLQNRGKGYVFGKDRPVLRSWAEAARKRLKRNYDCPAFSWQMLRRTCGTYLTCASAIYGAASAFLSAKRLGHSVQVAERHYAGAVTSIPATAKTIESAMGIADLVKREVASRASSRRTASA